MIRHDILIDKLENVGIRGSTLSWFSAYLNGRKQKTVINKTMSHSLPVRYGVPQGSSLGPILFLIYINDFKNVFKRKEISIFADDTLLVFESKDLQKLEQKVNKRLDSHDIFLKENGIQLNENKTQWMLISSQKTESSMDLVIKYKNLSLIHI